MVATIDGLLSSPTIKKVISRVKGPHLQMLDLFGMNPGGRNVFREGGKKFAYDTFNNTRSVASGRRHGVGPATIAENPIGNVSGFMYRSHEKMVIPYDKVFGNRDLGKDFGRIPLEQSGKDYIRRQTEYITRRFRNARELILSRMFAAGSVSIDVQGDDMKLVPSGGNFTIDFQHPAGNRGDVGGIFAQNWGSAPTTAVPNDELMALNNHAAANSGLPIAHALCSSLTWAKVLNVSQVQNLAGSANRPFTVLQRTGDTDDKGNVSTSFTAVLAGMPWLTWHIMDQRFAYNGTETQVIPDDDIVLTPEPSSEWLELLEGSEMVRETTHSPLKHVYGMEGWRTPGIDPAAEVVKMVDGFMFALYIPSAFYYVVNATA